MDIEMLVHPVVVVRVRTEGVDVRAAQDPDEEVVRHVEIGHGESDVVGADKAGQWHSDDSLSGSNVELL
jgi:hypothetical protein